ncbi:clathrin light chain [Cavenderia fasciculata]|uniref:Clathrin light chain n=1 Tax=Cavenderia fasciculata TaxID=261658 RepID=F4Q3U8_CACFS|nr:clathrin light chain [Cavenderia fasciculata]EGG17704.1 clathrin light chain [Cavenderia fasciculata]|eukprot:XP_004356188.1 clathrin light chain [Cavenderia fasciculata]
MSDPFEDTVEVTEEIIEGDYVPEEGENVEVFDGDSWTSTSASQPQTTSSSNNNNGTNGGSFDDEISPSSNNIHFANDAKKYEPSALLKEHIEKHEKLLKEKQRVSEEKRQKKIADAKKSLETFYAERETKKTTARQNNRDHNKTLESDLSMSINGKNDSWEVVVSMIDLTAKPTSHSHVEKKDKDADSNKKEKPVAPPKDTSRMKEVLLRLKNKPTTV